ncbi:MAG: GDSL-type esterase/lipase family protein [Deltaproteobacteria bacterium]|jgi:lysophospholipase L1-like esterase|nr:GDSL-type esterase/lipase family protein [Deltaproteobacteria bacterium]
MRKISAIVLLGDSLTAWGDFSQLKRLGEDIHIHNLGVPGNATAEIYARIGEATALRPSHLVLMAGVNDLFQGIAADEILDNHRRIWKAIAEGSPETSLSLLSLLPINRAITGDFPSSAFQNGSIRALNSSLRLEAERRNIPFLDFYPHFSDKQLNLDENLTEDGVHLLPAAYTLWVKLLLDYFSGGKD